jgi:gliding motility-associated lipoprotein GldH
MQFLAYFCRFIQKNNYNHFHNHIKMLAFAKYQPVTLAIVAAVLLLSSCGPKYILDDTKTFKNNIWRAQDSAIFTLNVVDTTKIYNIYVDLAHTTAYANANVYVQIGTQLPTGKTAQDVVSFELADQTGQWLGSTSGATCALHIPLREGAVFKQAGKYQFSIKQFMRTDTVQNISSIGMKVEQTDKIRTKK